MKAIILAAGMGKRLGGDLPKVMQTVGGLPLLRHVLNALDFISENDVTLVVGYKKEDVFAAFPDCAYAVQEQQLGTGHAALMAEPILNDYDGSVLVCYGDMPLFARETYTALAELHASQGNACTMLSGVKDIPFGYGRITRGADNSFSAIVEEKDCTETQRAITEINAGVYIFDARTLFSVLKSLTNNNAQNEYYLTDAPEIIAKNGGRVGVLKRELGDELLGVSTQEDLAAIDALLRSRA